MAAGLGGSWGTETQDSPNRQVGRLATSQGLASKLHYQKGMTSDEVKGMDAATWAQHSADHEGAEQGYVSDLLRAYEHYGTTTT